MSNQTTYDATRDPRTGRPVLPIDEDNTRKAEAESLPLTDEDNQGIDIGDDDAVGEEDDLPRETAQSSVDVNATVPRMKAAFRASYNCSCCAGVAGVIAPSPLAARFSSEPNANIRLSWVMSKPSSRWMYQMSLTSAGMSRRCSLDRVAEIFLACG